MTTNSPADTIFEFGCDFCDATLSATRVQKRAAGWKIVWTPQSPAGTKRQLDRCPACTKARKRKL